MFGSKDNTPERQPRGSGLQRAPCALTSGIAGKKALRLVTYCSVVFALTARLILTTEFH
jgi:hypothetical protein